MDRPNATASPSAESSTSSSPALPIVKFLLPATVTPIDRPRNTCKYSNVKIGKQLYEIFSGDVVTEAMLSEAAKLFSENYGTWGEHSQNPGKPVKLGARRLREQYLPDPATESYYVRVTLDGNLAGNAFYRCWKYNDQSVCWVTQLLVDRNYRERGFASGLLRALQSEADDIYGIMSSHPVACLAAASSFGMGIERVPLDFARENTETIMKASPIPYIREARQCDHEQPQEALEIVQQTWQWPLGDLLDGHSYSSKQTPSVEISFIS
ncbi:hypothetical protein GX50_06263 [[Emmonsia] crescens]|uniref:N-acetyltransferase domain-containing protein n=1 Tax=[Emmonsia] crescens TaxID=73230 RepID=A0A2B7ZCN7_9EURO|nr:hypothetical protein GX50_06263 [Emmonsia crescens]